MLPALARTLKGSSLEWLQGVVLSAQHPSYNILDNKCLIKCRISKCLKIVGAVLGILICVFHYLTQDLGSTKLISKSYGFF